MWGLWDYVCNSIHVCGCVWLQSTLDYWLKRIQSTRGKPRLCFDNLTHFFIGFSALQQLYKQLYFHTQFLRYNADFLLCSNYKMGGLNPDITIAKKLSKLSWVRLWYFFYRVEYRDFRIIGTTLILLYWTSIKKSYQYSTWSSLSKL